jgi:hypothetical protein
VHGRLLHSTSGDAIVEIFALETIGEVAIPRAAFSRLVLPTALPQRCAVV